MPEEKQQSHNYRLRHGLCHNCGKVDVSQAINCVPCQIKLNERAQLIRWDRQADREERFREKQGLIPSEEAAEILGLSLSGFYKKVARGAITPAIRSTGGSNRFSWYKRSELLGR